MLAKFTSCVTKPVINAYRLRWTDEPQADRRCQHTHHYHTCQPIFLFVQDNLLNFAGFIDAFTRSVQWNVNRANVSGSKHTTPTGGKAKIMHGYIYTRVTCQGFGRSG